LELIPIRLRFGRLIPRTLSPEWVDPMTTPPTVPTKAAPPASRGIFALLAAWAASFPALRIASRAALAPPSIPFEIPLGEVAFDPLPERLGRDGLFVAFGFRAAFAFALVPLALDLLEPFAFLVLV
jgi:hypothetical protein